MDVPTDESRCGHHDVVRIVRGGYADALGHDHDDNQGRGDG